MDGTRTGTVDGTAIVEGDDGRPLNQYHLLVVAMAPNRKRLRPSVHAAVADVVRRALTGLRTPVHTAVADVVRRALTGLRPPVPTAAADVVRMAVRGRKAQQTTHRPPSNAETITAGQFALKQHQWMSARCQEWQQKEKYDSSVAPDRASYGNRSVAPDRSRSIAPGPDRVPCDRCGKAIRSDDWAKFQHYEASHPEWTDHDLDPAYLERVRGGQRRARGQSTMPTRPTIPVPSRRRDRAREEKEEQDASPCRRRRRRSSPAPDPDHRPLGRKKSPDRDPDPEGGLGKTMKGGAQP